MSELLFLGTGAADWNIEEKGDSFRRNAAALVNRDLLIDCGKHIFDFAESFDRKELYTEVTDVIITHIHPDHLCRETLFKLAEKQKIRVGCCEGIVDYIGENANIEFVVFEPYIEAKIGAYTVIPLLANHDVVAKGDLYSYHYIIQTADGKKIFYGLDGAWFLWPSWQEMAKQKFDVMVLECTAKDSSRYLFVHNSIPMLRMMVNDIKDKQLLTEHGKIVASHFSKYLHGTHEETKRILEEIGVLTAFDAMKITF